MKIRFYPLAASFAAVIAASSAVAETTDQDAVIVTATRYPVTANESLASVTVINRSDIERSQARTLPEILRGLPGVDVTTQGGDGKLTSVFLRGTNSGHVLVLVDGIKIGSATSGTTAWEFLPLAEIERIEIVRGPRSSLYGSEAMGGVIQIFTRRGRGPFESRAEVTVGSFRTNEVNGGISGSDGKTWYNLHAGRLATRGFNARQPVVEFGTPLDEPDHDGYDSRYASLRWGHRLDNGAEIELHKLHSEGNTEYDSTGNNEDDFVQDAAGARLRLRPVAGWDTSFQFGRSRDDRRDFRVDNSIASTRFETVRQSFSWQNDLVIEPSQLLTLGYDALNDGVSSTTGYDKISRDNEAVFGQYQNHFGAHDVSASLRRDNNEQFGRHSTGNLGWGYALTERLRAIASYGTAFKAPTFNDLYYPGFSNPNLRPEESKTTEFGLKANNTTSRWAVQAFRTDVDHLIALDSSYIPQNVNRATIKGIEGEAAVSLNAWKIAGGLTFLDPRNEDTGKVLQRRSRRSAKLDLDRRFGHNEIGVSVIAQGPRFDDAANSTRVGGYSILNLRAQRILSKDWQLRARVENILDKEYQTVQSYNSPRRSFYLTLGYQPSRP